MQLPGPGVFGPPRDHDQALAVLRRAIELGINHIDTAQFYGPDVANELIREALHPYPANLALVSKVGGERDEQGNWLPAQQPDDLRRGIEDNLRTLETDRLAAVNLRVYRTRDDPSAPADGEPRTVRPPAHRDDPGARRWPDRRHRLEQRLPRASADRARPHRDRMRPERIQPRRPHLTAGARRLPRTRHRVRAVLPARFGFHRRQPGARPPRGSERGIETRPHACPDRAGVDTLGGAQRVADPGHLVRAAPGGKHGRRRHRTRRRHQARSSTTRPRPV